MLRADLALQGGFMLRRLSPEQAQKCKRCEWRDKTNDCAVICPWAGRCIKGEGEEDIPMLPKSRDEE